MVDPGRCEFSRIILLLCGITLSVHCLTEEDPITEKECKETMQNNTAYANNWNTGNIESLPDPLENGTLYATGRNCYDGVEMEAGFSLEDWKKWFKENCPTVHYIPPHYDIPGINKILRERGFGSRCKSGLCAWDSSKIYSMCFNNTDVPNTRNASSVTDKPKDAGGEESSSETNTNTDTKKDKKTSAAIVLARSSTIFVIPITLIFVKLY